jgi:hypothetical protein
MIEQQTARRWHLPLAERAVLALTADLGSVAIVPLARGERPRVEVGGHDADLAEVSVRLEGDITRVDVAPGPATGRPPETWDVRVTAHLPAGVRVVVRSRTGRVTLHDLGPCTVEVSRSASYPAEANGHGRACLGPATADGFGPVGRAVPVHPLDPAVAGGMWTWREHEGGVHPGRAGAATA